MTGSGAGRGVTAAFLLVVLGSVFVALAVPRYDTRTQTAALRQTLATVPSAERSVVASADWPQLVSGQENQDATLSVTDIGTQASAIASGLTGLAVPLGPSSAAWSGVTSAFIPSNDKGAELEVAYRSALAGHSQLIAGRPPDDSQVVLNPGVPVGIPGGGAVRSGSFQVAATQATAARLGLSPGTRLTVQGGITLVVTGVIRPSDPGSAFWTLDPVPATPEVGSAGGRLGGVFVGPDEVRDLQLAFGSPDMKVVWDFPLALAGVTAGGAGQLAASLNAAADQQVSGGIQVSSGLSSHLTAFLQTKAAVDAVLSLLLAGLGVISVVVVLLGVYLVARYRVSEFAVRRARGITAWHVAAIALRGAAVAGPAAVAGAVVAVAVTPGADSPLGWWLAGALTLVALAGPPLLALHRQRAAERATPGTSRRRLLAEVTACAAAAGGLVITRQQGPPAGGFDLYTAVAPVLVAVPAAVLATRLYPLVLRGLLRLAAARRGVTAFVAMARAARGSPGAALPAFALVLALGVAAFGGMVRDAVLGGEVAASWQTAGADAVIDDPAGVTGPARLGIAAVPGVRHLAAVRVVSGSLPSGGAVEVVVVDPASYAALIAASPWPGFPAGALRETAAGPVPAVASAQVAASFQDGRVKLQLRTPVTLTVRVAATQPATPALPGQDMFLVLPSWAVPGPSDLLLVNGPGLDEQALLTAVRRDLPAAKVTRRSTALAALTSAPLQRAAGAVFAWGIGAAAGFSALIVVLSLAIEARARELALARLAAMGLAGRQARLLLVLEALPMVLAAATAGGLCGWILVPLASSAVSLSVFTGNAVSVPVRADAMSALVPAAALVVLALILVAARARPVRDVVMLRTLRGGG